MRISLSSQTRSTAKRQSPKSCRRAVSAAAQLSASLAPASRKGLPLRLSAQAPPAACWDWRCHELCSFQSLTPCSSKRLRLCARRACPSPQLSSVEMQASLRGDCLSSFRYFRPTTSGSSPFGAMRSTSRASCAWHMQASRAYDCMARLALRIIRPLQSGLPRSDRSLRAAGLTIPSTLTRRF